MAYNQIVKNQAFLLYCLGNSYNGIAEQLRELFPEKCKILNRATIQEWATNHNWGKERAKEQERSIQSRQEERSLIIRTATEKIEGLIPKFFGDIEKMEFSSREGGVYATNVLLKMYKEFSGELTPTIKVEGNEEVVLFLDVLNSIPEIRMAIEKYKSVLGKRMEELKKKLKSEKLIEQEK